MQQNSNFWPYTFPEPRVMGPDGSGESAVCVVKSPGEGE